MPHGEGNKFPFRKRADLRIVEGYSGMDFASMPSATSATEKRLVAVADAALVHLTPVQRRLLVANEVRRRLSSVRLLRHQRPTQMDLLIEAIINLRFSMRWFYSVFHLFREFSH